MSLQKNGSIIISSEDFVKGMAPSPYLGIQRMINLDIHERPGALTIAHRLELSGDSDETFTDVPQFGGFDSSGDLWAMDRDGTLCQEGIASNWIEENTFGTTNDGGFVWKNYFIAIRTGLSGLMDAYGPLVGSPTETASFQSITFNSTTAARAISYVSLDDRVYIGIDNYLMELVENDGEDFDPTDSDTWSWSEGVCILPEGVEIKCIAELGTNLLLGTTYQDSESIGDIFVWNPNKSGTDEASPDERIRLSGQGVYILQVNNNRVYAVLGESGEMKVTDLSQVQDILTVNDTTEDPTDEFKTEPPTQNACSFNGGILFTLYKDTDEALVYQYKNNALTAYELAKSGEEDAVLMTAFLIAKNNKQFYVGWQNEQGETDEWGMDMVSATARYQSYKAYFISQLYNPGRDFGEKTYTRVGFTFGKKLTADQGIRIKYREDLSDSWSTLGTWTYATIGGVSAHEDKANLPTKLTNLQLRVELTTGTGDTTPELISVYLK